MFRSTRLLLALLIAAILGACGHTSLMLRDSSADAVAAVTSAWPEGSFSLRHDDPDGTVTIEGREGDNGASAWCAIFTIGMFWPHPIVDEVVIAPEPSGVALSVRVRRWTQVLYLIPIIQRYEDREEELLRRIKTRLRPQEH